MSKHRHVIDKIGYANALISGLALYPQAAQAYATGSVQGLSLTTFIVIALNSVIWTAYGIHRRETPIIISSSLNCLAAIALTVLIIA